MDLEQKINEWIKEPGFIREVKFETEINRMIRCSVTSADSQPEFYNQTWHSASDFDLDCKTALEKAISRLDKVK